MTLSRNKPRAHVAFAMALAVFIGFASHFAGWPAPLPTATAGSEAARPTESESLAAAPKSRPTLSLGSHGLQQVALTTRNLPRAIHFYRDMLGMRFLFESNGMAFFDLAGTRLMIGLDPERPSGRPTSVLYFDAPDFDATIRALEAAHVAFDGPVETVQTTARGDLKLRQFHDPDGNALAVMGTVEKR